MKLISMQDFVLESISKFNTYESEDNLNSIVKYANFLKQPLTLGMFVPCDEDGNVLEEPSNYQLYELGVAPNDEQIKECGAYEKAKEKILFEGIEFITNGGVNFLTINEDTFAFHDFNIKFKNLTVEFLVQYNLQLTESAIKQIGL